MVESGRTKKTDPRCRRRGFSLVEMMLVVAIFGVMTAIAISNMRDVIAANIGNGAARSIAAFVKRARVLAATTHSRVRVTLSGTTLTLESCKSRYGSNACVGTTTFQPVVVSGTLVVGRGETRGASVQLSSTPFPTITPLAAVTFDSGGFVEGTTEAYFVVSHTDRPVKRTVRVTAAGEVKLD